MKPVVQEDSLGCGIACVAYVCGVKYKTAKERYFRGLGDANKKGFLCKDLVLTFSRAGKVYEYKYLKTRKQLRADTIVFIKRSEKYPFGHYLAKTTKGWMDPWINFSKKELDVTSAKSGFRKRLPGRAVYGILSLRK